MLVRRRDGAVAPQIADGLCQRRDDALQQSLGAQRGRTALERVLQRAGIERFHGGDAFIKEATAFRRLVDRRARGVAVAR